MSERDLGGLEDDALAALEAVASAAALEAWRVDYLGRKGRLAAAMRALGAAPAAERPRLGQKANRVKARLEEALATRAAALAAAAEQEVGLDVTLPARPRMQGRLHPVTLTRRRIERVFRDLGFDVVEGPEVEWDTYNFDRLRVPRDHPARDMWDTIWIDPPAEEGARRRLLRTHTSPMQIRYLEQHRPPIRVIVPGTCYRYEATDATHEWMLTQIEGLVIDEGITLAQLKGTLESFVHRLFGPQIETRFRCDYFPFVEPGAELAIRWRRDAHDPGRWLEMLGAGMVHPEIIAQAGLDPSRYTGFAFGMGVERFAMLRYEIPDIRYFYANDLRFLEQFPALGGR